MNIFRKISVIIFFVTMSVAAKSQINTDKYVLVHNKAGLKESVTLLKVQSIFQAKYTRWPETENQVIIVLPSSRHPEASEISKMVYKSSFREVQKFWLSIVFQGRFNPPVFLDSDKEIIEFVEKNTGAVGIVSADAALLMKPAGVSKISQ